MKHVASLTIIVVICRMHRLRAVASHQLKNATVPRTTKFLNRFFSLNSVKYDDSEADIYSKVYARNVVSTLVKQAAKLPAEEVFRILEASTKQHKLLPNILRISTPPIEESKTSISADGTVTETISSINDAPGHLNVCGDTHGQFKDVLNIFSDGVGGYPSAGNVYVFNGDLVDRGPMSFEIVMSLLSMKLSDPSAVHILRGNHESISMSYEYGFRAELARKYPSQPHMYQTFIQLFRVLPIAAVIDDKGEIFRRKCVSHNQGRGCGTATEISLPL